jgi:hypothetical protein
LPVIKNAPPLGASYQSITAPAEATADNVTVPGPQRNDDVLDNTDGNAVTYLEAVADVNDQQFEYGKYTLAVTTLVPVAVPLTV